MGKARALFFRIMGKNPIFIMPSANEQIYIMLPLIRNSGEIIRLFERRTLRESFAKNNKSTC